MPTEQRLHVTIGPQDLDVLHFSQRVSSSSPALTLLPLRSCVVSHNFNPPVNSAILTSCVQWMVDVG